MKKQQQGFAILTTVVILSIAGISYTTHMAYLQLIDNKVLANYYRNIEAFANAESGINLILSKLTNVDLATEMIDNLPYIYNTEGTSTNPYQVTVSELTPNKLHVSSIGHSTDGSAIRTISLEVYYYIDFDTPIAPLLSNGKLKINASDSINDGCGGLTLSECRSPGNIAQKVIISQPATNQSLVNVSNPIVENNAQVSTLCSATILNPDNSINININNNINLNAIHGQLIDEEGGNRVKEIINNQWGAAASITSPIFDGVTAIDDTENASSLFESTFGTTWENMKDQFVYSESVAHIDMTNINSVTCSEELNNVNADINIIYIKGNCIIDPLDTLSSNASDITFNNNYFTIGTTDSPKMVFLEGGTFIAPANTISSVVGMLYLIPATHDVVDINGNAVYIDGVRQLEQDHDINLAGIQVNGSLLSEYSCTASAIENSNNDPHQNFSTRYDKHVLNSLYKQLGMEPSESHYQLVAGTWRDF